MAESITLDPSEVATGRTELNITPWIAQGGADYGDAALVAYASELAVGSTIVDFRLPNRQISIPLIIRSSGGTTFEVARETIQAKVGIMQQQGGWLKRVTSTGGTVFADVVSATLTLGADWIMAHKDVDVSAQITLETIPDFYGAEQTLADHTETTLPEISFTETTTAGGDFPLGDRVRVVVDEDDAENQRGLIWSFRGRHYSAASTAASSYQAESLTPLDTAAVASKGGASGGQVVTHSALANYWLPVVGTNLGGAYLTHTGTNRLYARVYSASGTTVSARFVYDVGDLVHPTENDAVRLYNGGTFHILDLGELRLDPPPSGTHRWQGQIQAMGDAGSESFSVDRVWIVNQDESAGVLSTPTSAVSGTSSPAVRDDFRQTAGALHGKTATVGGAWTTTSGTAGDFSVTGSDDYVAYRSAVSDPDTNSGRYAVIGSAVAACIVRADVKFTTKTSARFGVLARYADTNNWLMAFINPAVISDFGAVTVAKRVGGSVTTLAGTTASPYYSVTGMFYRLSLSVDAAGNWNVYWGLASNDQLALVLSGTDSALATGGALASGKVGLYDAQTVSTANTRTYDNLVGWAPDSDAVIFASQSAELNSKGIIREDSAGAAYGPVSSVTGDLPRMPNRSSAGTVEFFAKASRGDLRTEADPAIDDISARIYRRASYLTVG